MMYKSNDGFIFGLILFSAITGFGFGDTQPKSPFGPKMCDRFCRDRNDCTSYSFATSSLTCHLYGTYSLLSIQEGEILFNINQALNITCPHYSVFIKTRRHIRKCLKDHVACVGEKRGDGDVQRREDEDVEKFLLVAQFTWTPVALHQIFLSNNSEMEHPFIRTRLVEAIAYISKTREVLVSSMTPNGITAYSKLRKNGKPLSDERTLSMAIDEEKGLVFSTHIERGINRMTICGGEHVRLTNDTLHYSISVDPKRQSFYIIQGSKYIVSVNYNGKFQEKICLAEDLKIMTFDPKDDVLYYTQNNDVFTLHNQLTQKGRFVSFDAQPKNMVYCDGKMYASFQKKTIITVARINRIIDRIKTVFKNGLDLCFTIPGRTRS